MRVRGRHTTFEVPRFTRVSRCIDIGLQAIYRLARLSRGHRHVEIVALVAQTAWLARVEVFAPC